MKNYLLCCDWGTSSFRLRLVNRDNQDLIGEVLSPNGIGKAYNLWQEVKNSGITREDFFRRELKQHIDLLSKKTGLVLDSIAIVLSGMASSSIGIKEIAYARLPFSLDGSQIAMHHFGPDGDFPHEIMLLSGVRSDHDVMRGEETELIGLAESVELGRQDAIFIFPGTHSKHMFIRKGLLVDFKTYMTGEVFNVMSNHSILKDSIDLDQKVDFLQNDRAPFEAGVKESADTHILNALFTVRTNQLFDLLDKKQNGMFLSGLLIGSEMRQLTMEGGSQLILCCQNNLYNYYKTAIEVLNLAERTSVVPPEIVARAATAGQIKIFENQNLTLNKVNL